VKPILAGMIGAAFGDTGATVMPTPTPGRRRKLWEMRAQRHCPLIGTCLPVAEMRKLATRAGYDVRDMSDYSLHATVVSRCDARNELAELIQRWLEKRHIRAIARFERSKDAAAVMFAWREALAAGDDIAGALWAAWSHPALDEDDGKEIYGDLHMLSHQVGAGARADLRQLDHLKRENARLRDELQAFRLGLGAALGLDLTMLREVFSQTGARSGALQTDGEDMQNRDHSCFFSAAHAAKDSGIALKLAKEQGLNLPLATATKKQYDRMIKEGLGELDKSGIAELTFKGRHA